jgi:hypothetical protein
METLGPKSWTDASFNVKLTAPVVANEFLGHDTKEKSKPRPFKAKL